MATGLRMGFPARAIGLLVLGEGGMLGLAGGVVGVGLAVGFLRWGCASCAVGI